MIRFFIYLFPAAIDLLIASTAFVCSVRGAEAGWEPSKIASLFVAWSLTYMIVCQIVARVVTPQNAARLLVGSSILLAAISACFIIFPSPRSMHYLMAGAAFGGGFFFAPFQVFMKTFDQARNRSVAYSAGVFLFAWSAGFAAGPFVAGFLWEYWDWQSCYVLNVLVAAGTAAGVYLLKLHAYTHPAPHESAPAAAPPRKLLDYSRMPELAWLGWLCGGLAIATFALFRSLFPKSGAVYDMSTPALGTIFFVASIARAFTGLLLSRSRSWMYRPLPVAAFGLFGIAGMALVAAAGSPWAFGCGAALYGVFHGAFFFYMTFHSLVHPTRSSRYVSINESIVGAAGIAGAFVGGQIADALGLSVAYLAGAGFVVIGLVVQAIVHSGHSESVRELERQ